MKTNLIEGSPDLESEPKLAKGFVMWVDVLGFRNLMKADGGIPLWREVWRILDQTKLIMEAHGPTEYEKEVIQCKPELFGFTAFSDSIVASVDLSSIPVTGKRGSWHAASVFLKRAAYLCRMMLEKGLPVRGGIDYGEFYHQDEGFAGKPFVEAEQLSGSMEFAACLFTERSCQKLDDLYAWLPSYQEGRFTDWFEYDCEMKTKERTGDVYKEVDRRKEKRRVLDIFRSDLRRIAEGRGLEIGDFSQGDVIVKVRELFSKHGKDIRGEDVTRKVNNTVELLEHARANRKLFQ